MFTFFQNLNSVSAKKTQVKDFDSALLIGAGAPLAEVFDERFSLAMVLAERGVDVYMHRSVWPRDTLFFSDNNIVDVDKLLESDNYGLEHEAYCGGKFLKGDNFIVASDSMIPAFRPRTEKLLNADKALYLNLTRELAQMYTTLNNDFYDDSDEHIDRLFNIGNRHKKIFTYNLTNLMAMANDVASETSYDVVALPFNEVRFAAVGFVELGDHMVVDCRAKKTMKVLKEVGYKIIPTPLGMIQTNKYLGSVRCTCTEMPKSLIPTVNDELEFKLFDSPKTQEFYKVQASR
ncbi:MAG: hypothetical protein KKF89_06470 [Nanoarchaeota archaeon]|nr:hypothetical protein [Nanoarchaeota archaeon]MBU1855343.1 hypothetical protein [Nanoarchaeota archaeon]